ncbi:MAG: hypothetical protein Q4D13_00935 [Erysipelotrichaceae bacterium]|nr:hypothetical protein [Erysipelotrichaceae bacterium]
MAEVKLENIRKIYPNSEPKKHKKSLLGKRKKKRKRILPIFR